MVLDPSDMEDLSRAQLEQELLELSAGWAPGPRDAHYGTLSLSLALMQWTGSCPTLT